MKHTPEPWRLDNENDRIYGSGLTVCCFDFNIHLDRKFFVRHEANGQRIVECVNAMAGIEDPQKLRDTWESIKHLELDAYQEAQEQIERKNVELMNQSSQLDMKNQRITDLENVLKDLKTILDRDQSIDPGSLIHAVIEKAIQ